MCHEYDSSSSTDAAGVQRKTYQRRGLLLAVVFAILVLSAFTLLNVIPANAVKSSQPPAAQALPMLALDPFASGLVLPVGIVSAGDDRLFVVEKAGRIRVVQPDGTVLAPPFLDITALVRAEDQEQGLLGLVFAPDDVTTFYVYYIAKAENSPYGVTTIARYHTMTNTIDVADPNSAEPIFTLQKNYTNHNAGDMAFGPDGNLYVAVGDGGGGGDPDEVVQDLSKYWGKILRIYVTGVPTYTVPTDNPFANDGDPDTLAEIWAYGVRNPWRMNFDRATDDIYFGEVGEANWEEVNRIPAGTGGRNFGWDCFEGNSIYETEGCGPASAYEPPIYTYPHEGPCTSVTGGYVYRGTLYPNMGGHYLFGDFCHNRLNSLIPDGVGGWNVITHTVTITAPVAFGQDHAGELYVAAIFNGTIYKIRDSAVQPTPDPNATPTPTKTPWPSPTITFTPTDTPTVTPTSETPPTHTPTPTATNDIPPSTGTPSPTATTPTTGLHNMLYLPIVGK